MSRSWFGATALFLLLLLIYSCSGGKSPTEPGTETSSGSHPRGERSSRSGTYLSWVWNIEVDPAGEQVLVVPERGAVFTCNVVKFLESPPAKVSGKIVDSSIDGDKLYCTMDVALTNPFTEDNFYGFDVIGVLMGAGSDAWPGPEAFKIAGEPDQRLLNPDGYTRWFNYPEFSEAGSVWDLFGYDVFSSGDESFVPSAELNPYKYYADGIDVTEDAFDFLTGHAEDRGSYAPQNTNSRRYELCLPLANGLTFKFAVIAHWKRNVKSPDPPESLLDFPPEANADEALLVRVEDESTVYWLNESDKGGYVRLKISPWDWSANLTSTVMEEYAIRCYSDAWDGAYEVDMKPVYSWEKYYTFKTAIPVTNIHSLDPIPVWIEVRYPLLDYSNEFGVENEASGNLAGHFYTEVLVHDYKPVWLNVIQPNGGELLEVGKSYEINWESENLVGNVFIMFALDDFVKDVHPIAVNEPNDGSFLWNNIPDMPSKTVKVRVSSMKNSAVNDRSDDYFTIFDSTVPFIRVVSPNGGELWKAGTARTIKWVSKNVPGNVFIEYSKDNFASDVNVIAIDTENDGSFLWEDIPHDLSQTVRVRISSMQDAEIFDVSDADFIIDDPPIEVLSPDGGEEWKAGSSHEIEWETLDFTGTLKIEYSKDYFVSDVHLIASNVQDTGSRMWENIPNDPTTTARVRISSTADPSVRDISDANFSIEESGWGVSFGGSGNETGYDIDLDSGGNIYVTGIFSGSNVDFDPDPAHSDLHSSKGGFDIYLTKFDSLGDFVWARTWGGTGYDRGYGVAADESGNVYVTGVFKGANVDFDPGTGVMEKDLHSSNGSYDVFVSKFDATGEFLWARTFGGALEEKGTGVDTDQLGDVYLTGCFRGAVDFNPGSGTDSHTALGAVDIYLSALEPDGDFMWADTWGGNTSVEEYDQAYSVAVGDFGDVYVTGNIAGENIDLDPDPADEKLVTAVGGCDAFLSKFDLSGNFEWGGIWGADKDEYGFGLATDADGYVYVTGRFEGMVDFDPGEDAEVYISSGSGYDAYLSKFDLLGNHQWARTWGGADFNFYGWSVHAGGGTAYVIGDFDGTGDFDPGPAVEEHSSNGDYDIFLSSFNSSGWFNWARTWGGETAMDYGYGVYCDGNGNAFITGSIAGNAVDFNPGEEVDPRTTYNADAYIIKVLPDGEW